MLLTHQQDVIDEHNASKKANLINDVSTTTTIEKIKLLEISPTYLSDEQIAKYHLKFEVTGKLNITRDVTDRVGFIKKIHSPGRDSDYAIDIEIGLTSEESDSE
jgi:hypothetical protein